MGSNFKCWSRFNQRHGRAGQIQFDYVVEVAADGVAELNARAMEYGDDEIVVRETVRLNGSGARGVARSRIAVRDHARSEV